MATYSVWDGNILCEGWQHSLCGMPTFIVWDGNILSEEWQHTLCGMATFSLSNGNILCEEWQDSQVFILPGLSLSSQGEIWDKLHVYAAAGFKRPTSEI